VKKQSINAFGVDTLFSPHHLTEPYPNLSPDFSGFEHFWDLIYHRGVMSKHGVNML
jgi:hypothetical protein